MQNFYTLNENKTEVIDFGSHTPLDKLTDTLGPLSCHHFQTVRNLGVFLDSAFKLEKQSVHSGVDQSSVQ